MAAHFDEPMPFLADVMDRRDDLRAQNDELAAAASDPAARLLILHGDGVAMAQDGLAWGKLPVGAATEELIYLGEIDGAPRFASDAEPVDGGVVVAVRDAVAELAGPEAAALLQAAGITQWHRRHRFCAHCGSPSLPAHGGHVRRCPACGTTHFPRTDPAVIMLVTAGERCVLGQRPGAPGSRWSTLAGYVEPGESLEAAVAREVHEEVGLRVDGVTYVGSQPWPFPASMMVAFDATAPYGELSINAEHRAVRWFGRDELRAALASGEVMIPGRIAAGGYLIRRWVAGGV